MKLGCSFVPHPFEQKHIMEVKMGMVLFAPFFLGGGEHGKMVDHLHIIINYLYIYIIYIHIFTVIYHKNQPNVGKYTIHGWYGLVFQSLCSLSLLVLGFPQGWRNSEFWGSKLTAKKLTRYDWPWGSNHLVRWWLGCIITSSARYLGSITILRRWLEGGRLGFMKLGCSFVPHPFEQKHIMEVKMGMVLFAPFFLGGGEHGKMDETCWNHVPRLWNWVVTCVTYLWTF